MLKRNLFLTVLSLMLIGVLAAACASNPEAPADASVSAYEPQERHISVLAVQHDMDRHVDRTAFPNTLEEYADFDQWPGYRLDTPNEDGMWRARAYAWSADSIIVNQGDEVTLEFFGIHGDLHPGFIEGYDIAFAVRRGEITRVTFTADKAGIFKITCPAHLPTMEAQLVVLPAS
jgi:nitrous oxide reductase